MSVFTEVELHYLRGERLLGRLATVGPGGMPHIAPVGWRLDPDAETIVITGSDLRATKKFPRRRQHPASGDRHRRCAAAVAASGNRGPQHSGGNRRPEPLFSPSVVGRLP